jgi:hypothetical protein
MFTKAMSGILAVCNILLFLLLLYHIGIGGLSHPPVPWEYKDLITIILTALAVLLAAITILIGLITIWGYNSIRQAAVDAAETKADESAKRIAESVAARTAQEFIASYASPRDSEALTRALSEEGTDERSKPPPNA